MLRTELRTGWTVRAISGDPSGRVPGTYPAEVPGCVHTDLMAAGVIPDPYLDGNEAALRWMYDIDWRYATALDRRRARPPAGRVRASGSIWSSTASTPSATVRLGEGADEIELGRTYNMHRSYRFDISPHLTGRPLELEVDLHSATAYAEAERQRLGDLPRPYPAPYNFIRKMACSFGWDWGPDLRTAGLWKPVRLERWSVARLAQVRPLVTVDAAGTGRVELRIDLERLDPTAPLTAGRRNPGPPRRERSGCRRHECDPRRRCPRCARLGGRLATASSRWPTSPSPCRQPTRNSIGGSGGSVSAPWNWTPPATTSAPHSPFRSTASRCSSKASTGSPMITS